MLLGYDSPSCHLHPLSTPSSQSYAAPCKGRACLCLHLGAQHPSSCSPPATCHLYPPSAPSSQFCAAPCKGRAYWCPPPCRSASHHRSRRCQPPSSCCCSHQLRHPTEGCRCAAAGPPDGRHSRQACHAQNHHTQPVKDQDREDVDATMWLELCS